MNTYESNINDRIANAKAMIKEADELSHQIDELLWNDNKLWIELHDKRTALIGNIKRSVRSLAKNFGFTIKETEFMDLIGTWEGILGCIEHRWNLSQQFLHEMDDYTRMYFTSANA